VLCETGTLIAQSWTSSSLGNVDLRSALRATRRTCSPATASPRHSAERRCRPGRSRPIGAVQTAAIISATRGHSTGSIVAVPSGRDRHRRDGDPFLAHWTGMTQRGRTNLHASYPDHPRSINTDTCVANRLASDPSGCLRALRTGDTANDRKADGAIAHIGQRRPRGPADARGPRHVGAAPPARQAAPRALRAGRPRSSGAVRPLVRFPWPANDQPVESARRLERSFIYPVIDAFGENLAAARRTSRARGYIDSVPRDTDACVMTSRRYASKSAKLA
jgi:hypothetical protein